MTEVRREDIRAEIRRRALADLKDRGHDVFRATVRAQILGSLHKLQINIIEALAGGARYIALCCGRRSGKTNLLAKLIVLTLLDAGFNQAVFYVAPTLKIGKGLIWAEVAKLIEDYRLDWTLREHTGEIITPEGARFFILGLNKRGQVDAARGFDALLFLTDETQEYEYLLAPTLSAVGPALSGRRGAFIAAGTPGISEQGTWFDWFHGKEGFMPFGWTVLDNPKNPRPGQDVIDEEKARRGWHDAHPELLREWYGKWVPDFDYLVAEFSELKNSALELPETYGPHWKHIVGIDYGYNDACAWVVLAANPYSEERLIVHTEAHPKLIGDQACEITARLVKAYKTSYVVSDYSGGGKSFYETFNASYGKELGCAVRAAKKMDKAGRVHFLNTELRTGRLRLMRPAADALASELKSLRWKDEAHTDILTSREIRDDLFDAALYALVETAPWQAKSEPTPEKAAATRAVTDLRQRLKNDPELREAEERNKAARRDAAKPWFADR